MKKIILFIKLQDMPSDGWLHGCVMCEQITGSIDKVSIHDLKTLSLYPIGPPFPYQSIHMLSM